MPRVIDKDELKKAIQENICQAICDEPRGCSYCRVDDVWDVIYEQPIVDAVEVVRCKNCKHLEEDECPWTGVIDWNGYCSRGEKRKESGQIT